MTLVEMIPILKNVGIPVTSACLVDYTQKDTHEDYIEICNNIILRKNNKNNTIEVSFIDYSGIISNKMEFKCIDNFIQFMMEN